MVGGQACGQGLGHVAGRGSGLWQGLGHVAGMGTW